jgi:GT2 family glycosyltransferase
MVIPVMGIPTISQPAMLGECVASIDAEVARLVIVDNSRAGDMGDAARASLPANVGELVVARPAANLGFSGSLNHVMRTNPAAPWWMFANADAKFAPGDMARVAAVMESESGPVLCGIRDFRLFAQNAAMTETVGWWDENFHPIYCEDNDYSRRIALCGARSLMLAGDTEHFGSATIRDQETNYAAHNSRTFPEQVAYYRAKWGGGIGQEAFATPFNRGGPVNEWHLSLVRLRDLSWTD